jgi:hypothetical protein
MNGRALAYLSILSLAACQVTDSTRPTINQPSGPSLSISDGSHSSGNVDFFFLPPIVLPGAPILANWTRNGFNPSLMPDVVICQLNETNPALITPATLCKPPAGGLPVTISGADVKKHFPPGAEPSNPFSNLEDLIAHYHAKYLVSSSCNKTYFLRVRVKVGSVELGFADVQCVTSLLELFKVDYKKFGAVFRGTTLQIPFRIEQYALCPTPGVGPCSTATVGATGGVVTLGTGDQTVGTDIPPGALTQATTITVKPCANASLPIDLPQFGTCVTVLSDPEVDGDNALNLPATVFDCSIHDDPGLPLHPQQDLVTLHRLHNGIVEALPHSGDHCPTSVGATASVKGFLAALTHGDWKAARGQLVGLLAPKPLYARRIDQGAGGATKKFSDFKFALPCAAVKGAGDGQTALPGSLLPFAPTATCRDLLGNPVAGATLKFEGDGVSAVSLVTPSGAGEVSVPWTIPNVGANTLTVSGRGVGGADFSGPRSGVDPFMAFPFLGSLGGPTPETGTESGPVELQTGSVAFTATGTNTLFAYSSGGHRYLLTGEGGEAGFEGTGYDDSAWLLGTAPFGGELITYDGCTLYNAGHPTNWPIGSTSEGGGRDLLIRRSFNLPGPATIKVSVAIDNDVQVFLNGTDISGGLVTHEGCAERPTGPAFVYSGAGVTGSNLLAIRGRDRGVISYLDFEVVRVP